MGRSQETFGKKDREKESKARRKKHFESNKGKRMHRVGNSKTC